MEEDKRFAHIATNPKFRRISKAERKVKIDKRFQSMFKDKQFKVKYTVDSRGRPINRTSTEDLKRYYHLSSEESSSEEEEDNEHEVEKYVKLPKDAEDSSHNQEHYLTINESDKQIPNNVKEKLKNLKVDYARGENHLFSESSSDDSEPEGVDIDEIEHKWGELDADAERTNEITYRLAACNMDWDRIRAIDLLVLFTSFVPQGGLIESVVIYPSEFGKERMKEEEIKGPIELVETKIDNENEDENEEGSKYHMEKLRKYQLNRLKYYYAVITCDSKNTANKIYTECDGMEYESSATKIDLRFIPDDMAFDEEPKEVCDKILEASKYQPRFFTTSALQQAKVNLTWDETNPERIELAQKLASGKVDDIDENDLQAYLAASSGDEDPNEKVEDSKSDSDNEDINPIDKYRALLSEIETKEKNKEKKDIEMEISWGIDLKEKTDKLIKQKQSAQENKTPFQQYLEKRKQKRKEKREERKKKTENGSENDSEEENDIPSDIDMNDPYFAEEFNKPEFKQRKKSKTLDKNVEEDKQKEAELELLLMNDDNKKHFNLKSIQDQENESKSKKKRNKKISKESADDFQVDVGDERFSALYTSHHFNIDPTDSHYKKTKGMDKLINEKFKRRNEEAEDVSSKKYKYQDIKKDAELNVLVKSVKRKAKAFVNKKN